MKSKAKICLIAVLSATLSLAAVDALSKKSSFSSRSSFSKSSSSSKSFNFRDSSKKSTKTVTSSTTSKTYKKTDKSTKTTASNTKPQKVQKKQYTKPKQKFGSDVAGKQKVAASRDAYKRQKAAFKKPVNSTSTTKVASNRSAYSKDSAAVRRASRYDRNTYYDRRSRHYGDWSTPSYAYNSYSSFGMWDALALWFILDHVTDAQYANMYYHQMNDPGIQQWRAEADKLARENAELRNKLSALDSQTAALAAKGVTQDPNYLPEGVDADIFLSDEARELARVTLNLCTGPVDLNYHNIGVHLAKTSNNVDVRLVPTRGSAENLAKLDSGECDAALTQRDAYLYHLNATEGKTKLDYNRIFSPYAEVVHLVCHMDSGVEDLTDLKDKNRSVIIGGKDSGSNLTWSNLVAEDDAYGLPTTLELDGALAKSAFTTKKADCILSVSGLNTQYMKDLMMVNKDIELVEWDDKTLDAVIDPAGQTVYSRFTLPDHVYSAIQIDNVFGWFNVDTEVATVPADFVVTNKWAKDNELAFDRFVSEATQQLPSIRRIVGSK